MGTWGEGLFDDDTAADTAGDAREARPGAVGDVLRAAVEEWDPAQPDPYPPAAGAALVLYALDATGVEAHAPYVEDWPRSDWTPDAGLVALARATARSILDAASDDPDESLQPLAREQLAELVERTASIDVGAGTGGAGRGEPRQGGPDEPRRRWWGGRR